MGAGYASGKFAIAICDQCGQRFRFLELIKDWKGFKVCQECYEPKHPQLEPKRNITEPQALYQPRPEPDSPLTIYLGPMGDSAFASVGMQPAPIADELVCGGMVGQVKVIIT
jgi:NAD-dependent SIR2 family protein deacetylase